MSTDLTSPDPAPHGYDWIDQAYKKDTPLDPRIAPQLVFDDRGIPVFMNENLQAAQDHNTVSSLVRQSMKRRWLADAPYYGLQRGTNALIAISLIVTMGSAAYGFFANPLFFIGIGVGLLGAVGAFMAFTPSLVELSTIPLIEEKIKTARMDLLRDWVKENSGEVLTDEELKAAKERFTVSISVFNGAHSVDARRQTARLDALESKLVDAVESTPVPTLAEQSIKSLGR